MLYVRHGKEESDLGLNVNAVIYFYMLICISLLLYNVTYIFRSKGRSRRHLRRTACWSAQLDRELETIRRGEGVSQEHQKLMMQRLKKVDQLMAYQEAMKSRMEEVETRQYLDANHDVFQVLAAAYCRRPPMERAFFAYLIRLYHPDQGREHDQLAELLLDFLDDSTVYCRENVFQALCAMGNGGAIERLLIRLEQQEWYHNPKLLSDGLTGFAGDREALAKRLWSVGKNWTEPLQVVIVQFAANLSSSMSEEFILAFKNPRTLMETRFALARYFQRHPMGAARAVLLKMAVIDDASGESGLAIAACSALVKYPGNDTVRVLKQALYSRNWYVRYNAASSLVALGIREQDIQELLQGSDRYAAEMLAYICNLSKDKGEKNDRGN